jgi:hydrogenase maturation factor
MTVPEERIRPVLEALRAAKSPAARVIGEITNETGVLRVGRGVAM